MQTELVLQKDISKAGRSLGTILNHRGKRVIVKNDSRLVLKFFFVKGNICKRQQRKYILSARGAGAQPGTTVCK